MSSEPGPTLSVCDLAARIRGRVDDALPAASLHALCYCALAWSLAHPGGVLFPESFHAGDHGPICPDPHARAQALDRQLLRWAGVNRLLADR